MRIARVLGHVTLNRRLEEVPAGHLALVEALDATALESAASGGHESRAKTASQSLVCFDQHQAAVGQLIAISEGAEATMPFKPKRVPIDAYNAAILDRIEYHNDLNDNLTETKQ